MGPTWLDCRGRHCVDAKFQAAGARAGTATAQSAPVPTSALRTRAMNRSCAAHAPETRCRDRPAGPHRRCADGCRAWRLLGAATTARRPTHLPARACPRALRLVGAGPAVCPTIPRQPWPCRAPRRAGWRGAGRESDAGAGDCCSGRRDAANASRPARAACTLRRCWLSRATRRAAAGPVVAVRCGARPLMADVRTRTRVCVGLCSGCVWVVHACVSVRARASSSATGLCARAPPAGRACRHGARGNRALPPPPSSPLSHALAFSMASPMARDRSGSGRLRDRRPPMRRRAAHRTARVGHARGCRAAGSCGPRRRHRRHRRRRLRRTRALTHSRTHAHVRRRPGVVGPPPRDAPRTAARRPDRGGGRHHTAADAVSDAVAAAGTTAAAGIRAGGGRQPSELQNLPPEPLLQVRTAPPEAGL